MNIPSALTCLALIAVLVTTACDQPPNQQAAPVSGGEFSSTAPPYSAVAPPPGQPGTPQCNRRASLRPQDPLPKLGLMPVDSTMAHIERRGYLIAGVNQDTYRFAFRDENLRLQGFDIDIVRDIAEAIFGDRERVVFRYLTAADRIKVPKSGEVDLVVASVTITCERRQEVDFSAVYFETGQRVLVNRVSGFKDLASLADRPVCASRGSTSLDNIQAAKPKPIPVAVSATSNCLALLQLGKVDAVSTDDALLAAMAAQDPQTEIVGPPFTEEPYGVVINKDTPDLVRFVNAVLERRIRDGRWRASYERWLAVLGQPPAPPIPQYQD